MHTIILTALFALSTSALAAPKQPDTLRFELKTRTPYGKHWTQVYQSGATFYCKTDLQSYFELKALPYAAADFAAFPKKADKLKKCQTKFVAHVHNEKQEKSYAGCYEDPRAKAVLDKISKACGR